MFSRFYRPSVSWIAFLRKAWQEKIPERSEDDFFLPAKPFRAALRQKAGNPRPLPLKSGKTDSFQYEHKKCRPSDLHSYSYIDIDVILFLWNRC